MHCTVSGERGGSGDDDHQPARATGYHPDGRRPCGHLLPICVVGRPANALILGLGPAYRVAFDPDNASVLDYAAILPIGRLLGPGSKITSRLAAATPLVKKPLVKK